MNDVGVQVVVSNVHFVESSRNAATSSAQSGRGTSSPWTQSRPAQSQSRPGEPSERSSIFNCEII
jgi:hypothetical protein